MREPRAEATAGTGQECKKQAELSAHILWGLAWGGVAHLAEPTDACLFLSYVVVVTRYETDGAALRSAKAEIRKE